MWMAERLPNWSGKAQGITNGWLKMGLKERTITRKLRWGVPVRKEGYEGLVFYVWFDAPIGYISMTQEMLGEKYKEWWMNAENTDLYQFMGKDNVPFHALMFPSSLLGTHLPYTTVTHICSTEYLLF
jgi:methionyl-tRNA synthetase